MVLAFDLEDQDYILFSMFNYVDAYVKPVRQEFSKAEIWNPDSEKTETFPRFTKSFKHDIDDISCLLLYIMLNIHAYIIFLSKQDISYGT